MTDVKVNQNGRPCPDWCTAPHSPGTAGPCATVSPAPNGVRVMTWARPWQSEYQDAPEVVAFGYADTGLGNVSAGNPSQATAMAEFFDIAAEAGPEALRSLAAEVREASSVAWPETEPEAGA